MVARAGFPALIVVDSLMVGRSGAEQLGYLGLGLSIQMILMMAAIGGLQAVLILTAQAVGSGQAAKAGLVWRVAMFHSAILGSVLGLACFATGPILAAMGQEPKAVAGAARVAAQLAWGLPGILFYLVCSYFLEAIGRPLVGMAIMIIANIANAGLNWIFVFGEAGFVPALGAEGAVLVTSFVRWLIFGAAIGYMVSRLDHQHFGISFSIRGLLSGEAVNVGRRLRRVGLPMGVAQSIEAGALQSLVMMAGLLGTAALAAYHVTVTYNHFVYMIAIGCSAATSIRVGRAVGQGSLPEIQMVGWAGMALVICLMLPVAGVAALAPEALGRMFIDDGNVLAIARSTITVLAGLVLSGGLMAVSIGALRGAGDTFVPMLLHTGVFWILTVPLAWLLGLKLDGGAVGMTLALLTGFTVSAAVMWGRFFVITRREILRV